MPVSKRARIQSLTAPSEEDTLEERVYSKMGEKFILPDGLSGVVVQKDGEKVIKIWHKDANTGDRALVMQINADLLAMITAKYAIIQDTVARSFFADADECEETVEPSSVE